MKTSKAAAKSAAFLKQKKYRSQWGEFIVEGIRAVEEAVEYGKAKMIFYVPSENQRVRDILSKAQKKGIALSETYEGYMAQIADTVTPQEVIAICAVPQVTLADVFGCNKMVLVLDRVQDPGNVGTLLRTADAGGIGGVICLNGCADVYSPKTVRSSMGSVFHIPVVENITEAEFLEAALKFHFATIATDINKGESVYDVKTKTKSAIIVGNEANGLSSVLLNSADQCVYIPIKGRAESLNVAIAAAVVIFVLNR